MPATKPILTSVILGAMLFLTACGGSSSHSTTPSSALSIALNPAPSTTTTMVGNTKGIQFTAVVSNDSSNAGVDWAITCPAYVAGSTANGGSGGFQPVNGSFPCGTLSVAPTMHTASGKPVTYTPPSYLSSGATTVTIVAFATADHTHNVSTPVAVNSYTSALKGTYILEVQGTDGTNPYQATGAFAFDGKGNITSGEETYNTVASPYSSSFTVQGSGGTPSTYFVGADGRGTITINVQQTTNPASTLTQNLSFVVLSSAKAFVADLGDFSNGIAITLSGAGTLELQDSTAATTLPTGAYAFVLNGIDSGGNSLINTYIGTGPLPTATGGVINIDNTGSISSASSLADEDYEIYNYNGGSPAVTPKLFSCPPASLSGVENGPDSFGSISLLLIGSSCFGQPPNTSGSIQLTGYIVDSTHIRLIESDDTNGSGGFLTAGIAISQGCSTCNFSAASLSGNYVFGISGMEGNSFNSNFFTGFAAPYVPWSFTSAGVIAADGNGNYTGETDTFFLSGGMPTYNGTPTSFNDTPIHGTYAVDPGGLGRVSLSPVVFLYKGSPSPHPYFLFYLTGNGNPPLALWAGGTDQNFPSLGVGETYVQAPNPNTLAFGSSETYGVNFTAVNTLGVNPGTSNTQPEDDGSGSVTSNNGTWTGNIDDAYHNIITIAGGAPLPLSGNFVLSTADAYGRLNGDFMYNLANGGAPPTSQVAYYMADPNHAFFVETDWPTLFFNNGTGQVGWGYFAQACDVTSATSCPAAAQAAKKKPSLQVRKRPVE